VSCVIRCGVELQFAFGRTTRHWTAVRAVSAEPLRQVWLSQGVSGGSEVVQYHQSQRAWVDERAAVHTTMHRTLLYVFICVLACMVAHSTWHEWCLIRTLVLGMMIPALGLVTDGCSGCTGLGGGVHALGLSTHGNGLTCAWLCDTLGCWATVGLAANPLGGGFCAPDVPLAASYPHCRCHTHHGCAM
jgi:hypothetical protein